MFRRCPTSLALRSTQPLLWGMNARNRSGAKTMGKYIPMSEKSSGRSFSIKVQLLMLFAFTYCLRELLLRLCKVDDQNQILRELNEKFPNTMPGVEKQRDQFAIPPIESAVNRGGRTQW